MLDERILLELALSRACWTHNTNVMVSGYNPLTLMTGKSVVIPGISTGNRVERVPGTRNTIRFIFKPLLGPGILSHKPGLGF